MYSTLGDVRPLTLGDLGWVLDLSGQRRERIAGFAPRFWRPAPDARDRHEMFLGHQIGNPPVVSLRTDHGFVFAAPRANLLEIDDMALDEDTLWSDDGTRLLQAVLQHSDLRFVCPVPEPVRTQTATALGMSLVESWWHRDLATGHSAAAVSDPTLVVAGASGQLVEAPPVYAPGGTVLMVSEVASVVALAAIENAAAAAGAVVSVAPRSPGEPKDLLTGAGYKRTTDFFEGRRH